MNRRQKIRSGLILFSFFLFPATYYYFSPVLIVEASSRGIVNGSFILFALMFLSALLFGRGFCGWLCPAAGCQEALFAARDQKVRKGNLIKWLIWLPWIGAIVSFAIRAGGYREVDFFYQTTYGLSIGNVQSLMIYFLVLLLLIVLPGLLIGKRSFCHHMCWMAPFMILGRSLRNRIGLSSLQLQSEAEKCSGCGRCVEQCPMSLPVTTMVRDQSLETRECILCGSCVDVCRDRAIGFDWGKPQQP